MAGRVRNLLNRDGRWFARLVVPKELRAYVGKTELRTALGADYREALKKLPGAVALLQHQIALGERRAGEAGARMPAVARYPLAPDQIALRNYQARLQFDEETRNRYPAYATGEVDDQLVAQLRAGIAGRLRDHEYVELVGKRIERFRHLGNHDEAVGSDEWRLIARALCVSEYEALERVVERDEGDFSGTPTHPLLANAAPSEEPKAPVSLKQLFLDYIDARKAIGKGAGAEKRWKPVFADLVKFIGHDDARRLTKEDLRRWRDARLKTLSPRTVSQVYLASVRTVLNWAVREDRLETNAVQDVRQEAPKRQQSREKGYTLDEALVILRAARDHAPKESSNAATRESPQMTAAKRWVSMLCAFTGARVSEMTQLRKQDVREEAGTYVLRIAPNAGTVKAGDFRDVPVHPQLIAAGFIEFVKAAQTGPLFYRDSPGRDPVSAARMVSGRISEWLQELGIVPEGVQPNYGWRHRFKTVGEEEGVSRRTLDALQGHSARTAGETYGDITLRTRKAAIDKFPAYRL